MNSISFAPIVDNNSKVLILGTMPGIVSLKGQQYYANKRNVFWPIIFNLFNSEYTENYELRKNIVLNNKIALWDTLKYCYREGSLDSKIENEEPNEINKLLNQYKNIKSVIFNGLSAEKYYKKYNVLNNSFSYYTMPSTSPANAKKSFNEKLAIWSIVKELIKY
ncbi:MAG: DNA-deoxyinosine glycosylase [Bacteroidales bacterium]|nr:DNA-deoxyinosine glycosylase [Bacteroidales bacterium]MBN2756285.1 DNA-deoxyinosine glycosylase [Bacteroidales bacterium]